MRESSQTSDCLALAPVGITESRELIVDFTEPIFDLIGIGVLMKKPPRQSHTWMFISVLENGVWISVIAAYLFTSILLAIFDRYSPYSYRNKPQKYVNDEDKRVFTLKESKILDLDSMSSTILNPSSPLVLLHQSHPPGWGRCT